MADKKYELAIEIAAKDMASKALGGIGSSLKALAVAAGAAFAVNKVVDFGKEVVALASAEEVGITKLAAAVKASGGAWDTASEEIENYLAAELKRTALDDGDGRASIQALTEITGDYTKSLKLMPLVQDLAAAKGLDLATAAQLVGRVSAGNTSILTRYGIVLEKGASAQEALAAMQQKFGGQAEAYGNTTEGAMKKLDIATGNIKETIGGALLPVVANVASAIAGFLTDNLPKIETFMAKLSEIGSTVATVLGAIPDMLAGGGGDIPWEDILPPELADLAYDASDALASIGDWWNKSGKPAFDEMADLMGKNLKPILIGLGAVILASVIPPMVAWAAATIAATWPIIALGAVVAAVAVAWQKDFGGVRTFMTAFWENTLKPIVERITEWFQVNIPRAITILSGFWTNTLLPAMQAVGNWITGTLWPILQTLWNWLATNIPAAIATVSGFWTNTLLPAINSVWAFINDYLLPLFVAIADFMNAALSLAITALAGLWENVLLPAIQTASNWIQDNVLPVLQDIAKWVNDNVVPALQKFADILNGALKTALTWLKDTLLPPLQTALEAIPGVIERITGWFGTFADKLDELKGRLPDWLTPGSPTPLELGIRGLSDALQEMVPVWVAFAKSLSSGEMKGLDKANKAMNDLTEIIKDLSGALRAMVKIEEIPDFGKLGQALLGMVVALVRAIGDAATQVGTDAITLAQGMADDLGKIMGLVAPAVNAVASLAGVELDDLQGMGVKWSWVATAMIHIVTNLAIIAVGLDMSGYPAAVAFAESAGKIMALVGPAVSAITALAETSLEDLELAGVKWSWVETAILYIVGQLVLIVARLDMSGYPAAVAFAESAGKIVALIEPSIRAVVELAGVDVETLAGAGVKWSWVATAIFVIIESVTRMTSRLTDEAQKSAAKFAEVTGNILNAVKAGLGTLAEIEGGPSGPTTVAGVLDAFASAVSDSMAKAAGAVDQALADILASFRNRNSALYQAAYTAGQAIGNGIMAGMRAALNVGTGAGGSTVNTTNNNNYNIVQTGAAQTPNSLRTTVTALQMAGTA